MKSVIFLFSTTTMERQWSPGRACQCSEAGGKKAGSGQGGFERSSERQPYPSQKLLLTYGIKDDISATALSCVQGREQGMNAVKARQ